MPAYAPKTDMRRVEAQAILKGIAENDPHSMQKFLRALELLNTIHPQLSGKALQLIVNTMTPLAGLNDKERGILCPHTLSEYPTEEPQP